MPAPTQNPAPESISKPALSNKMVEDKRECLSCQETFTSSWIGNRICKACAGSIRFTSPDME